MKSNKNSGLNAKIGVTLALAVTFLTACSDNNTKAQSGKEPSEKEIAEQFRDFVNQIQNDDSKVSDIKKIKCKQLDENTALCKAHITEEFLDFEGLGPHDHNLDTHKAGKHSTAEKNTNDANDATDANDLGANKVYAPDTSNKPSHDELDVDGFNEDQTGEEQDGDDIDKGQDKATDESIVEENSLTDTYDSEAEDGDIKLINIVTEVTLKFRKENGKWTLVEE